MSEPLIPIEGNIMTTLAHIGTIAADTPVNKGKRTLVSLATIALIIGLTSGFMYSQVGQAQFAPAFATELTQASDTHSKAWDQLTAPASRKARCIMPPAWRRHCEL